MPQHAVSTHHRETSSHHHTNSSHISDSLVTSKPSHTSKIPRRSKSTSPPRSNSSDCTESLQPKTTYDPQDVEELNERAGMTRESHLILAANHMTDIFESKQIPSAIMGGLSLRIRGSERATHDVDIAIGCEMHELKKSIESDVTILRPKGPVSGVMRLYLKTKAHHDSREQLVMVDMMLSESLGVPGDVATESESLSFETEHGVRHYQLINLKSLMASKLQALASREQDKDYQDLIFLVSKYFVEISNMRKELNQRHRQIFINSLYREKVGKGLITKAQKVLGIAGPADVGQY